MLVPNGILRLVNCDDDVVEDFKRTCCRVDYSSIDPFIQSSSPSSAAAAGDAPHRLLTQLFSQELCLLRGSSSSPIQF